MKKLWFALALVPIIALAQRLVPNWQIGNEVENDAVEGSTVEEVFQNLEDKIGEMIEELAPSGGGTNIISSTNGLVDIYWRGFKATASSLSEKPNAFDTYETIEFDTATVEGNDDSWFTKATGEFEPSGTDGWWLLGASAKVDAASDTASPITLTVRHNNGSTDTDHPLDLGIGTTTNTLDDVRLGGTAFLWFDGINDVGTLIWKVEDDGLSPSTNDFTLTDVVFWAMFVGEEGYGSGGGTGTGSGGGITTNILNSTYDSTWVGFKTWFYTEGDAYSTSQHILIADAWQRIWFGDAALPGSLLGSSNVQWIDPQGDWHRGLLESYYEVPESGFYQVNATVGFSDSQSGGVGPVAWAIAHRTSASGSLVARYIMYAGNQQWTHGGSGTLFMNLDGVNDFLSLEAWADNNSGLRTSPTGAYVVHGAFEVRRIGAYDETTVEISP